MSITTQLAKSEQEQQVDLDLTILQWAWRLPEPWQIHPLARGTNNQALRVQTPAGDYILRVYSNHADLARLRFEQAVLAYLDGVGLPFAVPVPLSTEEGQLYARVEAGDSEGLATLTALIPGEHPSVGDHEQAFAGGAALGMLDVALAGLTSLAQDEGVNWRSSGDLTHCHPLVPDPPMAFRKLPVAEDARERLVERYEWLMVRIPTLYAALPRQIVHEDFDMSNVLLEGTRVTGVLDFEFCGRDVRVMDLAVALIWWPLAHFGTGDEWAVIRTLTEGYAHHVRLTEEEIAALPLLFQFRAYTSLIHRLGRHRQGLSSLEAVVSRVDAALEREDWLHVNGEQLVECVRQVFAGSPSTGQ